METLFSLVGQSIVLGFVWISWFHQSGRKSVLSHLLSNSSVKQSITMVVVAVSFFRGGSVLPVEQCPSLHHVCLLTAFSGSPRQQTWVAWLGRICKLLNFSSFRHVLYPFLANLLGPGLLVCSHPGGVELWSKCLPLPPGGLMTELNGGISQILRRHWPRQPHWSEWFDHPDTL